MINFIVVIILLLFCSWDYTRKNIAFYGGAQSTGLTLLQKKIKKKYKHLQINKTKKSFKDFCFPKHFTLQKPQIFVSDLMAPKSSQKTLIAFHEIGSGKTCLAIQTIQRWISHGKPLLIMPASLIPGFQNELRGACCSLDFISQSDALRLKTLQPNSTEYKQIITISNNKIAQVFDILSYNKIHELETILKHKPDPPILIIDEVHNLNNPDGKNYKNMVKFIDARPNMRLLLMTATPVFDHRDEILSILRLARIEANMSNYKLHLVGLISYFSGAPDYVFPQTTLSYKICRMSTFQSKWFKQSVETEIKTSGEISLRDVPNEFYIKSRSKSNIVFPKGISSSKGQKYLKNSIILNNLDTYSCKFAALMRALNRKNYLSFVYTGFTGSVGISEITRCLRAYGWHNYKDTDRKGPKYAVWSGNESQVEKDAIRKIYNSQENDNASLIRVVIGSPAIKEGVSLLRTRKMYVLETYWNHSLLEQVYGRCDRYCSHSRLPVADRCLDIYLYIAITHDSHITKNNLDSLNSVSPTESIDGYILKMADAKRAETQEITNEMINAAIDRGLHFNMSA